jgi:epoxyqueuosine reductase
MLDGLAFSDNQTPRFPEAALASGSHETWLKSEARAAGFDTVGIVAPGAIPEAEGRLRAFLERGRHGDMAWMGQNANRRGDPRVLWPEAGSIIMLGLSYAPDADPLAALTRTSDAAISVYAQGRDYHDVIKARLKALAGKLAARTGAEVKVFVDTAPVMEKPLAQAAGLGWQGKHTNLVSREHGSWLFLGAIFTTAKLVEDAPESDHCGSCRRCLDICPTAAFPAPYQLDARRCIAYLTIEAKAQIPREFRRSIGNRVYGCDDCLAVCPWNKFAQASREAAFAPTSAAENPPLSELLALDDAGFRTRFSGSPIKRIKRDRFVRNVLVAAGNSGDRRLLPEVQTLLHDPHPLVRGMAVWAFRRLEGRAAELDDMKTRHLLAESDPDVQAEWEGTL